jgi:hypothetical protein
MPNYPVLLGKLTRAEGDLVSAMLIGDRDSASRQLLIVWTSLFDEISQALVHHWSDVVVMNLKI